MYHGDIRLGDTLDLKFTTRRFTTGAPFTLAGFPVISAYVGNSTTEITAGITLTVDFDSRTGLNNVRVVATSGNGYATASNVDLVITTGTVDSVSVVWEVVASFSIEARSALMTDNGRARVRRYLWRRSRNRLGNIGNPSYPEQHAQYRNAFHAKRNQASIHRRQFRYIPQCRLVQFWIQHQRAENNHSSQLHSSVGGHLCRHGRRGICVLACMTQLCTSGCPSR